MALIVVGVRHHSPACARLVEATIKRISPRFVLIEGPSEMNARLGELRLTHTLPIALFSYSQDGAGASRGTWAPFCDYSPEWVALRVADDVGATPLFIDLPAWHEAFDGEENRYSDRHMRASDRLGDLCASLGFEDTDTLWDHLFEQPQDVPTLSARLASYFEALRGDEPAGSRDELREAFMCQHIAWAMRQAGERDVVVVCGGYHKPALERGWGSAHDELPQLVNPPDNVSVGSYLVPYSFQRLDSFSGYASGMPSPAFYQAIWEAGPEQAPDRMMFHAISYLRKKAQRVSPADAIAASTLAHGLRMLRGHEVLARTDVLDGLAGALIKDALDVPLPWTRRGTLQARTEPLLVELVASFSGQKIGTLNKKTPAPPLLRDAFDSLERVGIALTRKEQRLKVDIKHGYGRAQSQVLHRLRVLGIPGFSCVRSPATARTQTDLSEEWSIAHRLETDAALIEASIFGATLHGAAGSKIEARSRDAENVKVLVDALIDASLSGLDGLSHRTLAETARVIATEPSFSMVGYALGKLLYLARDGAGHATTQVAVACFDRALWLLEGISGASAPLNDEHVKGVLAMRDALRVDSAFDRVRAIALCERRARDANAPSALRGAGLGLLWSLREHGAYDERETNALLRSVARATSFGDFLGGLFALAREQVVRVRGIVSTIDVAISGFMREEFLIALPSLRQAFAYFPPRERLAIAGLLLEQRGTTAVDASHLIAGSVAPEIYRQSASVEREARRLAEVFGLGDDHDGSSS